MCAFGCSRRVPLSTEDLMVTLNEVECFSAPVCRFLDIKASRLVNLLADPAVDVDDVRQSLILALLRARNSFDADRVSWPTFAYAVIEKHAKLMLRQADVTSSLCGETRSPGNDHRL